MPGARLAVRRRLRIALRAFSKRLREDCRSHTGPLFDHVDTLSVVRDLDAVRAALGDEKLSFYGKSYGTLIGQQYAEQFPRRVRALALDSNMDHSLRWADFMDSEAVAVQDSFDEFVTWCGRDQSCALHGQDVRAFWARLLDRADRGELHFPGSPEIPLTELDLITQAQRDFYGPQWARLAQFMVAADAGTAPPAGLAVPKAAQDQTLIPFASPIFCQDFRVDARNYEEYAGHLRRSAKIAPDIRFNSLPATMTAICLSQPASIPNPQHRLRVRDSAPLLLGNSLFDPATPYEWAVNASRQLGRDTATLLTYEGWGHGVYGLSGCTTGAFDAYLISGTLPPRGTRCPAVPPGDAATRRQLPLPQPADPLRTVPGWTSQP